MFTVHDDGSLLLHWRLRLGLFLLAFSSSSLVAPAAAALLVVVLPELWREVWLHWRPSPRINRWRPGVVHHRHQRQRIRGSAWHHQQTGWHCPMASKGVLPCMHFQTNRHRHYNSAVRSGSLFLLEWFILRSLGCGSSTYPTKLDEWKLLSHDFYNLPVLNLGKLSQCIFEWIMSI